MTTEELWEAVVDFQKGINARLATIESRIRALEERAKPKRRRCPICGYGHGVRPETPTPGPPPKEY